MGRVLRILGGALLIAFLIFFVGFGVWTIRYASRFQQASGFSLWGVLGEIKQGLRTSPQYVTDGRKNILVLGLDALEGRGDAVLTDTILIVSIDLHNGKVTNISLPRDVWISGYNTKINALYYYGRERNREQPEALLKETVETITGLPVHHTVAVTILQVKDLVDALGGVEIEVERAFEDKKFPAPGVDVSVERDPARLYQTVRFEQGRQFMDGERVLAFMRSRMSEDPIEGTDDARSKRQMLVIRAVAKALVSPETVLNPKLSGALYSFYQKYFARALPLAELTSTAKALLPARKTFSFSQHQLSIRDAEHPNGVLYHPPIFKYRQWVYEPVDPSWKAVQEEIRWLFQGSSVQ